MRADSDSAARGFLSRRGRVLLAAGATLVVAALAAVVVAFAGDGGNDPPPAGGPSTAGPSALVSADAGAREAEVLLAGMAPKTVRFDFDAGPDRPVRDSGGRYTLVPQVAAGGDVTFARRDAGYAVRFPARCRLAAAECPRAILESTQTDLFNAGTRPIRFGAAVRMTQADAGPGANVLQKGFSTGGGTQFKLQVDGEAGRPSCVLATGQKIYRLTGPVKVVDGRWHRVTCTRIGGRMSINVDGRAVSREVPAALSIRNDQPLRIGGKGAGPNNDQFAGGIDDVFVTLY